ncbi:hypothetical protein KPH14_010474 [Odynerus spinipes]|uniref:Uncharacterized protein n=1 Tax=Odynerus spinipes TaxID=1348599 RepID=A0AAD9RTZ6_9HYME|nr:hypothetical protein KPH14_010474 [Odynerus spinipes]
MAQISNGRRYLRTNQWCFEVYDERCTTIGTWTRRWYTWLQYTVSYWEQSGRHCDVLHLLWKRLHITLPISPSHDAEVNYISSVVSKIICITDLMRIIKCPYRVVPHLMYKL